MNNGPISAYPFNLKVPEGDERERHVCANCGWIHYDNPKIVVGAVSTLEERFLLCRRAIEPRAGYWAIPAGYLEKHETPEAGAAREAMEEATAEIAIDALLAVYNVPRISQVQLIYRARLVRPEIAAGIESEAAALYRWEEIPWERLAFPTVRWALEHFRESRHLKAFPPFSNPS